MTLMYCYRCHREISNTYPSCPGCDKAITDRLATDRATGEKLKAHLQIAQWLLWIGLLGAMFFGSFPQTYPGGLVLPLLTVFIGSVVYLATRLRIWWYQE